MPKEYSVKEDIKEYHRRNHKFLKKIKNKVSEELNQKRDVMFSDIINFVIRKDYRGEIYTKLILWCNYKMRIGDVYIH